MDSDQGSPSVAEAFYLETGERVVQVFETWLYSATMLLAEGAIRIGNDVYQEVADR